MQLHSFVETAESATRLIYASRDTPKQSQTFDRKADAIRWAKQHETAVQAGRYLLSPEAVKKAIQLHR